jgi:hypothetical protein
MVIDVVKVFGGFYLCYYGGTQYLHLGLYFSLGYHILLYSGIIELIDVL